MGKVAKPTAARQPSATVEGGKELPSTHELELQHHHTASEFDLIVKDEAARRLQTRILLLKDENSNLKEQIDRSEASNAKLVSRCDKYKAQIEDKIGLVRSQEEQLRKMEREFSNVKAELQVMNDVSENSANIASEKLALARELAILKPEMENLQSQVAQHRTLLTEKLGLERTVATLESELAAKKKVPKIVLKNRESNDKPEDDPQKKLSEMEKKLAAETAERKKLEDQLACALQDQESTREAESDLRKKLIEAQKLLREQRAEKGNLLEELQEAQRAAQEAQQTLSDDEDRVKLTAQLKAAKNNVVDLQENGAVREHRHKLAMTALEEKNAELKKQLEQMESELKASNEKLQEAQEIQLRSQLKTQKLKEKVVQKTTVSDTGAKLPTKKSAGQKRKAEDSAMGDFSHIDIGTPAAEHVAKASRLMKNASLVGEKSTFSITPFLNRAKSVSMNEETATTDDEPLEDSMLDLQEKTSKTVPAPVETSSTKTSTKPQRAATEEPDAEKPKAAPKARAKPKKILEDATSSKKNALPQKVPKKTKAQSSLEKVAEVPEAEPGDKNTRAVTEREASVKYSPSVASGDVSVSSSVNGEPTKKRKRKVLGSTKTLFDDEEGEEGEMPAAKRVTHKMDAKPWKAGQIAQQKPHLTLKTTFSPLKRHRRGVNASFLS